MKRSLLVVLMVAVLAGTASAEFDINTVVDVNRAPEVTRLCIRSACVDIQKCTVIVNADRSGKTDDVTICCGDLCPSVLMEYDRPPGGLGE